MPFKNFNLQRASGAFAMKARTFLHQKIPQYVNQASRGASIFVKHLNTGQRLLQHANEGLQTNQHVNGSHKQLADKYTTAVQKGLAQAERAGSGLGQFADHLSRFA